MSSCFKLKRTEIAISEVFSKNIRDIRAKLWRSAAQDKSSGSKVSLRYDKLKVDDRLYVWDATRNCRLELPKSTATVQPELSSHRSTRVNTRKRDKK